MLIKTHQLEPRQLKELEQLRVICKTVDNSTPNLYTHILSQPRAFPASLLHYNDRDQLIAFLGIYFFYEDAVEVSVLVHPSYRKLGVGKQMLATILPLVQSQNFPKLIFSSPAHLNDALLKAKGFTYQHSEYYMERDELNPLLDYKHHLTYRTATPEDIALLCAFDEECFPSKQQDAVERFQHLFSNREYQIIIAYQNNLAIGKAHLRWLDSGATLSDIAITPAVQGQGLGTDLIMHCINMALSEGKPRLNLDVETHNERALKLYLRLGFVTQNACDYWNISLDKLTAEVS